MRSFNTKKFIHSCLVFAGALGMGFLLYSGLLGVIGTDFNAFFLYKQLRGTPSNDVVIVKIDNASLDALSKTDFRILTYTKQVYIDLIERLEEAKVRAIGFDLVLANPDPLEQKLATLIASHPNITIAAKLGAAAWDAERVLPKDIYPQKSWGMIDVFFDKNIITKIKPVYEIAGHPVENIAIRLYRLSTGDMSLSGAIKDDRYIINPLRQIPLDRNGFVRIPFFRHPEAFPSISLIDVLNRKYDPAFFRDKIVLVGEYGTLIHDAHFSPVDFGQAMPGVEFHANMLEGLLAGKFLGPLSDLMSWCIAVLIAIVSYLMIVYGRIYMNIVYFTVVPLILLIIGWYGMAEGGFVVDLFLWMVMGLVAPLVSGSLYRYFVVDSMRRFISSAFSHYISPDVVSEIARHPEVFALGGEKRELTVTFSDIEGFTTISERLGTDRLFALISEYLSEMTNILVANRGTLDKYIGDAVMGFYGAPLPVDRPEFLACKTALEQQERLKILSAKWEKEGIPTVAARIGINCGEVMVGNIGSRDRFNYTVMGDNVNLASRLEGINKEYGTRIIMSEIIYERIKQDFVCRRLDRIRVKWKTEAVTIYELLGFAWDTTIDTTALVNYEKALDLYFDQAYPEARELWQKYPLDPPSQAMSERCDVLIAGDIKLIDGIYDMHEK